MPASEQALVAKKILFISKSHRMLHLWHIICWPFSYFFTVLASIHVILMHMLGHYSRHPEGADEKVRFVGPDFKPLPGMWE